MQFSVQPGVKAYIQEQRTWATQGAEDSGLQSTDCRRNWELLLDAQAVLTSRYGLEEESLHGVGACRSRGHLSNARKTMLLTQLELKELLKKDFFLAFPSSKRVFQNGEDPEKPSSE